MELFISLIFYCSLIVTNVNADQHVIYVDDRSGVNNATCLDDSQLPCKTLEFVFDNLASNTQVRLLSGIQLLTEKTHVSHLKKIELLGNKTIISCNQSSAGLSFSYIQNLVIEDIEVQNCGSFQTSLEFLNDHLDEQKPIVFRSAVHIINCTDVTISNSTFVNNLGIGVTMFDTNGLIMIYSCNFASNSVPMEETSKYPGGGGLYIEHVSCTPGKGDASCGVDPNVTSSTYFIQNTNFTNNTASRFGTIDGFAFPKKGIALTRLGNGAGLSIALRNFAAENSFKIIDCVFKNNRAAFLGGAVAVQIDDNATNNSVMLETGIMSFNHAAHGGGGIEFGFFSFYSLKNNSFVIQDYLFESNRALYGGGVSFYSTRMSSMNFVTFLNCNWSSNIADVGAAAIFFPDDFTYISGKGFLPEPSFHNCNFNRNTISSFINQSSHSSRLTLGGGIVYSDTFSVNINGSVTFTNNTGSCIHISAAQINVLESSSLTMESNYARRGAGLSLIGYATLMACENSTISFINNTAEDVGGAVYYDTIDFLEFINSRRCFFRYSKFTSHDNWATNFSFIGNTATKYGHAIYATTLLPCVRANFDNKSAEKEDIKKVFVEWDQFTFEPLENYTIATDPAAINLDERSIKATPGNRTKLGLKILDDLNQTMDTVLFASCSSADKNCESINLEGSEYVTNDGTVIKGSRLNNTVILHLNTINNRPIGINLNVTLKECPPGYFLNGIECECSTTNGSHKLPGMVACNEQLQHGYLESGYWAGVYNSLPATAECPPGYCDFPVNQYNGFVLLPSDYDSIDEVLCVPKNRTGAVCGMCIENHSVYYHSDRFRCEKCDYPELGPLLYILSELVPLTIIFMLVIIFNINLMSGIASSFIFFAQTLDFFQVTLGSYDLPAAISVLTQIYWFLFGFFNLEFFRADKLSFCIFQNATTLDILAFKYITTAYGLILVCLLYILMNICQCHKIIGRCRRNADSSQYTVINGLTAFLVITYSQCAKVSFELLSQLSISVDGDTNAATVVLLAGHVPYFSSQHLKYAIPAIIVLCYLFIVPIFLVGHPLYFLLKKHVLASKKFQEKECNCNSSCSSFTLFMKPILDAFQAPYKDDARCFAGIMFFYRLIMSALFSLNKTTLTAFSSLEVFLIIMLMGRAIIHPFKKRSHNTIESLMFTNLALINGITLYNTVSSQLQSEMFLTELLIIQVILIYIPIILIVIHAFNYFVHLIANNGVCKNMRCFLFQSALYTNLQAEENNNIFDPIGGGTIEISSSFSAAHLPARIFEPEHRNDEAKKNGYGTINN